MTRFFLLALVCCAAALTPFTMLAGNGNGDGRAKHALDASLVPALAPTPDVAALTSATFSTAAASRAAYAAAWQRARTTVIHTDALRLADVLALQIGLRPGPTRAAVEQFVDRQLAQCPGCYAAATTTPATLATLIRQDITAFQRTLSAVLPDEAFARYTALLDAMQVPAQ